MDFLPESFFHYLWKLKLFAVSDLATTDGTPIQLLHTGTLNPNAGADFLDARLQIGDTVWAGTVEIHRQSADWWLHRHAQNKQYDNVILHVVYQHNSQKPIVRSNGTLIPTLELKDRIPIEIAQRYWTLLQPPQWIPCENTWAKVAETTRKIWLERVVIERLEEKTTRIQFALAQNNNDWEQTFYESLARSLGGTVNAQPMEQLARSLPQRILARHKDDLFQLEALLLGQAGLLETDSTEPQVLVWQREYRHLQHKYQLTPLPNSVWKFSRLRPANFPAVRLAQLARLAQQSVHLFSQILDITHYKEIYNLMNVELSGYWLRHFVIGEESPKQSQKTLGKSTIESIAINTIAPFLFAYGKHYNNEEYTKKSLRLLESLPAESNSIITEWEKLKQKADSAYDTQALLQLKSKYCDQKRCLECGVGYAIMRTGA